MTRPSLFHLLALLRRRQEARRRRRVRNAQRADQIATRATQPGADRQELKG